MVKTVYNTDIYYNKTSAQGTELRITIIQSVLSETYGNPKLNLIATVYSFSTVVFK